MKYFIKTSEFAPGIPEKNKISEIPELENILWEMAIQDHKAKRAGRHYDLRLADPNIKKAYSWAIRKWPEPGEKRLAVRTNDHTYKYMDFIGDLPKGYGEGRVDRVYRGPVKIEKSSPDKINFLYEDKPYTLVKTNDDKWIILNRSWQNE